MKPERHDIELTTPGAVATQGNRHGAELSHALRYGPFHRTLAAAIAQRGLSLARLQAHLKSHDITVAQSTLSYWQRGLRHPDFPRAIEIIRALELVLSLPRDSLVVQIGPRQRAELTEQRMPSIPELVHSWTKTSALLAEFAVDDVSGCNPDLDVLTAMDTVHIGNGGQIREVVARIVVRARRHGADSFVAIHQADVGTDISGTEVSAVDGCRMGRVRRQPSSAGMVFELLFDRRLGADEVHVFTFRVASDTTVRTDSYHRTLRARSPMYLAHLMFDPGQLPVRCTRVLREREDSPPSVSEPLVCGPSGMVSAYFADVGPGLAGVDIIWA